MDNKSSWWGCFGILIVLGLIVNLFRWLVTEGIVFLIIGLIVLACIIYVLAMNRKKAARAEAEEKLKLKEKKVLKLASQRKGYLTAAELVVDSELTLDEAGNILERLKSQGVCTLRISENGTYVYHFESLLSDQAKKQSERI